MTEMIFDAGAVRLHRDRAAGQLARVTALLDALAERLLDRLDDTTSRFGSALELGGRGSIAPRLRARGIEVISADFSRAMAARSGAPAVAIDGEAIPFKPASFDLVVAHLSLHWVNDLPGALLQLRQTLKPHGLFLASMPVLGTLGELRAALMAAELALTGGVAPRVSPFPDLKDCAALLQRAGFSVPVADLEEIELLYAHPLELLRELRAAGETNAVRARARGIPPRRLFAEALGSLPERQSRAVATLKMAIMTGWNA